MQERPHISQISNKPLEYFLRNSEFYPSCFAHIVPKSGFPTIAIKDKELKRTMLRENKDNILLVTPYEHKLLDHGTKEARDKYEKENDCSFDIFYNKREALKKQILEML